MRPTDTTLLARERADLRKALGFAMQEIRYQRQRAEAYRAALKRHDDNWRAMKGMKPRESPPVAGMTMSQWRRDGLALICALYEVPQRPRGRMLPTRRSTQDNRRQG